MSLAHANTLLPNPHFVYNSLNLLQAFIQEGNKREGLAYLSRFSKLLRQWLRHAAEGSVSLDAEIALLKSYLALERDRFAASFDFTVVCDSACAEALPVRPLAWHDAVEQAVYGHILRSSGQGSLRITFTLDDGNPVCIVHANVTKRNGLSADLAFEQKVRLSS